MGVDISSIDDTAFSASNLTSVYIPDNTISIGSYAFAFNQISELEIPSSVTYICEDAFEDNPLKEVIGQRGTKAEEYAINNNIPFKEYVIT